MALALGAFNSLPGWTAADVRWGSKERGVTEAELGAAVAELLPAAAATAAVVAVPQVDLSAFCLAVCLPGFARRAVKRGKVSAFELKLPQLRVDHNLNQRQRQPQQQQHKF